MINFAHHTCHLYDRERCQWTGGFCVAEDGVRFPLARMKNSSHVGEGVIA